MEEMRGEWRITLVVERLLIGAFFMPPSDYVHCPNVQVHVPVSPPGGSWPARDETPAVPLEDLPADVSAFTYFELFWLHRSLVDDYGVIELPA
jgi:hypothetical protein